MTPRIRLQDEEHYEKLCGEINSVIKIKVFPRGPVDYGKLCRAENRTYLWVELVIACIQTIFWREPSQRKQVIPSLPGSVSEAYAKILEGVSRTDIPRVKRAVQIIVAARRSLSTKEMGIAEPSSCTSRTDANGTAALIWSSWAGQYNASEPLLKEKADVNVSSPLYGTPLLVASLKEHIKVVKLLLDNGADIN
ncbi:ankyrin repeat domain-containing protein [Aspergillus puulaauensis]|uniref:Ankyrin repeat-containing domain protein n=1 Tax=Aspergillus puulaauensis TaxID=1220207 RepID=A0A7R8AQV5_9EURO|nr:uncharacterized protein APUU_70259A [Aspergillus puulaauensis]BCS28689.1 hypothetical protein APUU_70259A [Aspergillus puulaauensis]